ncbi:MAG: SMI1/KNR4 family protein [Hyalangium sp.]|uniref:SMI1/KNR4 family protein n=1 Tax=Hyalangium sp. TaxID=2028555 RepID=UPI00389A6824
MKEIIDFVSQYDPGFPNEIRGATEAEIARLEQLAGRKLPNAYRQFLKSMGRGMDAMGISGYNFGIEAVTEMHGEDEYDWPLRFLVIAEHETDPYYHYFMDLDTLHDGDCRVVSFDSSFTSETLQERHLHVQAASLQNLLFETAFICKRLALLPYLQRLKLLYPKLQAKNTSARETLNVFEQVVLRLGFRKLPFSEPEPMLFDRHDAAIYAKSGFAGEIVCSLAAQDGREVARLREILKDHSEQN